MMAEHSSFNEPSYAMLKATFSNTKTKSDLCLQRLNLNSIETRLKETKIERCLQPSLGKKEVRITYTMVIIIAITRKRAENF